MNYTITPEQAASSWYEQALQYELLPEKIPTSVLWNAHLLIIQAILEYKEESWATAIRFLNSPIGQNSFSAIRAEIAVLEPRLGTRSC